MAAKEPAMSPSNVPIEKVLDRAGGPRRAEVEELLDMCRDITGTEPVVWAGRIIGFGEYAYRCGSGHSGRAPLLGFAPGMARHTIYLTSGFEDRWPDLVSRLGKYKVGRGCLYLTRLTGVDCDVLRRLLARAFAYSLIDTLDEWKQK